MKAAIPISAVIATRNRAGALKRTLESLAGQSAQPAEIILVDSSDNEETKMMLQGGIASLYSQLKWNKANQAGAAIQRNQGVLLAKQPFIWFFDDDILFEPDCAERLWKAISSNRQLGGVNAMIVNQRYQAPGFVSRAVFTLMNGRSEQSFAGRVIGPAVNLLPEDRDDLPEVVPVEWLNTTCTIYTREALPDPPFPANFTGYSSMEDVALSLEVGKKWGLANARTARIVHDSQPGDYKSNERNRTCMELRNRYFVMTRVMNKRSVGEKLKFFIWHLFGIVSIAARSKTRSATIPMLLGQFDGFRRIIFSRE